MKIDALLPDKEELKQVIVNIGKVVNFVFHQYFYAMVLAVFVIYVFHLTQDVNTDNEFYMELAFGIIQDFIYFVTSFLVKIMQTLKDITLYGVIFYGIKRFFDYKADRLEVVPIE